MLRRTWPRALVGGLLVAMIGVGSPVMVSAQTAVNTIHACVNQINGGVRIVAAGASCQRSEAPVQWSITGPQGEPGPAAVGNYVANVPCYYENAWPDPPESGNTLVYTLPGKIEVWAQCHKPVPDAREIMVWFKVLSPMTIGLAHESTSVATGWSLVDPGDYPYEFDDIGEDLPYFANGTFSDGTGLWTYSLGYGIVEASHGWVTIQIIPTQMPPTP